MWSKLNFYEDSVGIPLIVAPPSCGRAGERCTALVSIVDWFPTVLDLTGRRDYFEELPGRSLLPLIRDPSLTWPDRKIIADYACDGTRVAMRMVRRGRWKAGYAPGFVPTLYDMEEDPHEWRDLGARASHRKIVDELRAAAEADGWNGAALTEQIRAHKRRLTYINTAETAE
jgi:choline-sulfatase